MCLGHKMWLDTSSRFPWFYRYLDLSDLTQFGWGMGLRSTPENGVHAGWRACILACTCTDIIVMSCISPRIHRYIYLWDPTQIGRVKILNLWQRTNGPTTKQTDAKHNTYKISGMGHQRKFSVQYNILSWQCKSLESIKGPLWNAQWMAEPR